MPKGSWREFDNSQATIRPYKLPSKLNTEEQPVRVQRTRGGKGGKTVTVVSGLKIPDLEAKNLLKRLKAKCGTGGTFKGEFLELQGDQVEVLLELLQKEGYCPKRSGG